MGHKVIAALIAAEVAIMTGAVYVATFGYFAAAVTA